MIKVDSDTVYVYCKRPVNFPISRFRLSYQQKSACGLVRFRSIMLGNEVKRTGTVTELSVLD